MLASLFASPVHYDESAVESVSVLSAFLRHLNTGNLALALFVALALVATTRGKEPGTRVSAGSRDTEHQLAITPCDTSLPAPRRFKAHKFTVQRF